jgi:cell wall-associated NlpC family hydrolase
MALIQKPIALDPGAGGRSIDTAALEPADIIVSTTAAAVSGVIRVGTSSVISHAALYAGDGDVIEAIGKGVVRQTITTALADDKLAVAYRVPNLSAAIAAKIIAYAYSKRGTPYSKAGAVLSSRWILCRVLGPRPNSFFCSQFVIEAFDRGGRQLTDTPAQCVTPEDVVTIAQGKLIYVGHLLGSTAWFPVVAP